MNIKHLYEDIYLKVVRGQRIEEIEIDDSHTLKVIEYNDQPITGLMRSSAPLDADDPLDLLPGDTRDELIQSAHRVIRSSGTKQR